MMDRIVETIRAAGISEERFDRDIQLSRHVEESYDSDKQTIALTRLKMIEALIINNAGALALIIVQKPGVLEGLYLTTVRQGFEINDARELSFEDTGKYAFYCDGMDEPKLITDKGNVGHGQWKFDALTLVDSRYGFKSLFNDNYTEIIFRKRRILSFVRGYDAWRTPVEKMIKLIEPNG